MTDARGRSFLSYRRSRHGEARLLIEAQRERGIPTWQDVSDLEEQHAVTRLREVLADESTANAVVWLTPDVEHSPTITRIELPDIMAREARGDGFFVVAAAAGGLDYGDVDRVAGTRLGTTRLGEWNLRKVTADPIGEDDAAAIAERVLWRRVDALHCQLPPGAPLRLSLYTREKPPPGVDLAVDWSHRFVGRHASQSTWDDRLLPALRRVSDVCNACAPGRALVADGKCEIAAAIALGVTYLATRTLPMAWRQSKVGRKDQDWSLYVDPQPSGFTAELREGSAASEDIALLLSVASNVEPAFAASRNDLPGFRGYVVVTRPDDDYPRDLATPGQARHLVSIVVDGLKRAYGSMQPRGTLHLFMSVPLGVAMMIGQMLNTFGPVQTYRHDPEPGGVGVYRPAVLLRPSA